MNNKNKLKIYNSLNEINYSIYKKNIPFDINQNNIKLTYNEIYLQYIKSKNYFVENIKKNKNRDYSPNRNKNRDYSPNRNKNYKKKYKGGAIFIYY